MQASLQNNQQQELPLVVTKRNQAKRRDYPKVDQRRKWPIWGLELVRKWREDLGEPNLGGGIDENRPNQAKMRGSWHYFWSSIRSLSVVLRQRWRQINNRRIASFRSVPPLAGEVNRIMRSVEVGLLLFGSGRVVGVLAGQWLRLSYT